MLLLDTPVLLWLTADQNRLSFRAKGSIKDNAGNLFISAISAFEIAVKAKKGKLDLPLEPGVMIHGINYLLLGMETGDFS